MNALSKLDLIRSAAKTLSAARAKLVAAVERVNRAVDAAQRRHLPAIRTHVGSVAEAELALREQLLSAPEYFVKPRTIIEAGIKFGYQGHDKSIELPGDKEQVAELVEGIKKIFTADEIKALGLLKTVEVPVAEKLLGFCTEKQLERLGLKTVPAGDHILIKPADAAVDKLVAKLLKAASDAAKDGEAA